MSAEIIDLAAARKARQQASAVPRCVFLLPVHVAAFYAEAWLAALRRISFGADEATAGKRAAELPRGQSGGGGETLPERPQFPGGIDDLEV